MICKPMSCESILKNGVEGNLKLEEILKRHNII